MIENEIQPIGLRRFMAFSLAVVGVVVACTVVLPALARVPEVRQRTQWLDDKGIDPTAMYYTELPVMESILKRQQVSDFDR